MKNKGFIIAISILGVALFLIGILLFFSILAIMDMDSEIKIMEIEKDAESLKMFEIGTTLYMKNCNYVMCDILKCDNDEDYLLALKVCSAIFNLDKIESNLENDEKRI